MSRNKSDAEYSNTAGYKFLRWLSGTKDPYLGEIEMQKQEPYTASPESILERTRERNMALERAYNPAKNKMLRLFYRLYKAASVLFVILMTILLLSTVSCLPATGEADKAVNNEVAGRYIESGLQETGATNIVTGMILTYRAFDTFGETNVLFIATICVMALLMLEEKEIRAKGKNNERRYEPKDDPILKMSARILVPIIFVFGIYIILNGQLSPGGGFSGGSVLGAGMILFVSAFGFDRVQKFFNENVYRVAKITALCMYGFIGSYFYITGANGIENHIPLGIPGHILSGGIILPIDIAVGIEVACTMYAFYALFRRGGL